MPNELTAFQQSSAHEKLRAVVEEYQNDSAAAVVSVAETILRLCERLLYAYDLQIFENTKAIKEGDEIVARTVVGGLQRGAFQILF